MSTDQLEDREVHNEEDVSYENDVFIIFCEEDKEIANYVCDGLEKHATHPLKCLASWKEGTFTPGKPVYHNIRACMDKSERTLLILTKHSLDSSKDYRGWVTLETILAIEKSKQMDRLILRVLLCDLQENQKELEFLRKGILEKIPHISVSFNKEHWEDQLVESLKKEIKLPDILPVGCVAHGQVFSHFTGFLSYVLPELDAEMKKTNIYRNKPGNVSTKYYILLPASSIAKPTVECIDEQKGIRVEKIEETISKKVTHAGKERMMRCTIYCAKTESEEYYFVADFPNVLNAIYEMHQLADVDIRYQIARFYYTLNEVVNHAENKLCNDTVRILPYNEKYETLADVVFCAAREDVRNAQSAGHNSTTQVGRTPQRLVSQVDQPQSLKDAVIIHYQDSPRDCEVAEEITSFLKKNKKTICEGGGQSHFKNVDQGRWIIFIFSREAIKNDGVMTINCMDVLTESIKENKLRVLPVLVDVEPEEVPDFIKWVTLLNVSEPRYCETLLQVMNGADIRMEHRLPAGDVATGLAWAYVINYLPITLLGLDFKQRIRTFLQEHGITCACIVKLYIVVPKSCNTDQKSIHDKANERLPAGKIPLKSLGNIQPVIKNTGGQHNRSFNVNMYQHTGSTGKTTCFITEYCTPVNCLHEMATMYPFAGLHNEDMYKQSREFMKKLKYIVNMRTVQEKLGDVSKLIELIDYDDEKMTLMEAFEQQIKFDDIPIGNLVFAEDARQQGDPRNILPSICDT